MSEKACWDSGVEVAISTFGVAEDKPQRCGCRVRVGHSSWGRLRGGGPHSQCSSLTSSSRRMETLVAGRVPKELKLAMVCRQQ